MGKSAALARLVSVCAVTALAGSALAAAQAFAQAPAAPALSVATPVAVRGDVVTTRGEARVTGLRITIAGVSPGGRAFVRVTCLKHQNRVTRACKRYSKVIRQSTTLRVVPGVYLVTSRTVAATGGTDVPKPVTKKLRVKKNRLTGFTVRYQFAPLCVTGGGSANTCTVGNTGPGGGKVFYVNEANSTGSRYMEAVVAGMTPAWDDTNAGSYYQWCVGTGQTTNVTTGTAIGTGKVNTDNMVAAGVCTSGTANSVRAYTGGGLAAGSWSLPSLDELNALDISGVGGLTALSYWSSSQLDANFAWFQNVGSGGGSGVQGAGSKVFASLVRPVRAF